MVQGMLHSAPSPVDINTVYGYPAGTKVAVAQDGDGEVHTIYGPDADPTANFANAPNGSIYIPMTATAGSKKIWVKYGATFGAKDGTWAYTPALT